MPIDDARTFIEKMNEDEAFRILILQTDSVSERSKLIREQGMDFNQDEYDQARDRFISTEAMDDVDLESDRSVEEATRKKWINQVFGL